MSEPQLFYKKSWTRFLPGFVGLLFVVMLAAISARVFLGVAPLTAFMVFSAGLLLCLLSLFIGVLVFLWGLIAGKKHVRSNGAAMLGLAAIPVIISVLVLGPKNLTAPPIHDITTDMQDPPFFSIAPKNRTEKQNSMDYGGKEVAEIQKTVYPDIQPLMTEMAPQQAFARCRAVVDKLGWEVLAEDPAAGMIEAVDSTRIFNFKDDIAVRVQDSGHGSRIDVRSVSRDGKGDFGTNANRIRRFIKAFGAG